MIVTRSGNKFEYLITFSAMHITMYENTNYIHQRNLLSFEGLIN